MQQPTSRGFIAELDVVRALAILGVFVVHATADIAVGLAGEGRLYPLYVLLNRMGKVGTTTFIFLSSVVLFHRYGGAINTRVILSRFYQRRLHLVALPYLIWTLFYYIHSKFVLQPVTPLASAETWSALVASMSWRELAKNLVFGTGYYHLYFVVINLQFYMLFPLLLVALRGRRLPGTAALVAGIVLQWAAFIINSLYVKYPATGSLASSYLSFYGLGVMVASDPVGFFDRLRQPLRPPWRSITSIRVIVAAWVVVGLAYSALYGQLWAGGPARPSAVYELFWNAYTLLSCVVLYYGGFVLYRRLRAGAVRRLASFGRTAFGMYLVHPILLYVWQQHHPFASSPLLIVAGGIATITVFSWLIVSGAHTFLPGPARIVLGASNPWADRLRRAVGDRIK